MYNNKILQLVLDFTILVDPINRRTTDPTHIIYDFTMHLKYNIYIFIKFKHAIKRCKVYPQHNKYTILWKTQKYTQGTIDTLPIGFRKIFKCNILAENTSVCVLCVEWFLFPSRYPLPRVQYFRSRTSSGYYDHNFFSVSFPRFLFLRK